MKFGLAPTTQARLMFCQGLPSGEDAGFRGEPTNQGMPRTIEGPIQRVTRHGKPSPDADQTVVLAALPPHVADAALADVVLPSGRLGLCAPLFFEAEGVAVGRAAAEIKHLLAPRDGPLQKMPVHEHVGVGRVVASQGTGAGHLGHAGAVYEQCRRHRPAGGSHDAQFRVAGELEQDAMEQLASRRRACRDRACSARRRRRTRRAIPGRPNAP